MKAYFSHDEGARNDPKLVKVLMRLGQAGKGVYWDLVEMLYEQGGYLPLAEVESYAYALRTEPDIITKLINDFGLFVQDADRFWSQTALERLQMRNEKAERRAAAGAKGGKVRAEREAIAKAALEQPLSDAQALLEDSQAMLEQSLSNKSKGKEIKEKETKEPLPSVEDAASAAAPVVVENSEQEFTPLPESPTTELRTPGGAADVGTAVEPAAPALTKQRGGKPLLAGDLADLLNPGGLAERVQKMKSPFTQAEADGLVAKYGLEPARAIVKEMANYAKLGNNVSANLTAQKWLERRQPTTQAVASVPMPTYTGRQQHTGVVHPGSVSGRLDTVAQARAELLGQPS